MMPNSFDNFICFHNVVYFARFAIRFVLLLSFVKNKLFQHIN